MATNTRGGGPTSPTADTETSRLVWYAAGLSAAASVIHGLVTPSHFAEWWGYGAFFAVAAISQMGYGALLLLSPWRYDATGGLRADGGRSATRTYYLIGVAGNAAIIVMYVVTRTIGIPFFGPEAGEVEPVAPLDLLSKVIEGVLIVVLLRLYRELAPVRREAPR